VTRHRIVLAALAAAALVWAPGAAAKDNAKPRPAKSCKAPKSGFRACLQVRYLTRDDGSVGNVRVDATLVRKLERCASRTETREVVIRRDGGEAVDSQRRKSTCSKGLMRWNAHFVDADTADWGLVGGSTVDAMWTGTKSATSVMIGEESEG
jgi:hypothetical protein